MTSSHLVVSIEHRSSTARSVPSLHYVQDGLCFRGCAGKLRKKQANPPYTRGNSYLSAKIGDLEDRQGGEVLGLLAALPGNPDEVTAETVPPCQVVSIHREVFLALHLPKTGQTADRIVVCE
jgi:hypothetical protein